jgi:predicted porin
MRTKLLLVPFVLATAGAGVQAQSSVAIYGLVDLGAGYVSKTSAGGVPGGSLTRTNTDTGSSSRLGFRGVEDLGGGLSALFTLELGIDMRNGIAQGAASSGTTVGANAPQSFFRRGSYVGLSHRNYGTLTLGRHGTAGVGAQAVNTNAIATGFNTGVGAAIAAQGMGGDFWNNNQIRYDSPVMGGFDFSGAYAFGEAADSLRVASSAGVMARYNVAPFQVVAAFQRDEDRLPTGKHLTWTWLSGSYTTSKLRLTAGYTRVKNEGLIAGWFSSDLLTLGARYNLTPALSVSGQVFHLKDKRIAGTKTNLAVAEVAYDLSKRTAIYLMMGHVDSGTIGITPIWGAAANAQTTVANATNRGATAGIIHRF